MKNSSKMPKTCKNNGINDRFRVFIARIAVSCLTIFCFIQATEAQQYDQVIRLQGPGRESINFMNFLPDGRLLTGGTYEAPFSPAGENLPTYGDRDFFLGAWNDMNTTDWILGAGSPENDELTAMLPLPDGSVVLAGSFFDSLHIAGEVLQTANGGYTVFILRYDPVAGLQWSYLLAGNGGRDIDALSADAAGELWALGNFGDDLTLADGTTLTAAGDRDALLLRFNGAGDLVDYSVFPALGRAVGEQLIALPGGDVVLAGQFDDAVTIGTTTLIAETQDEDIFLARIESGSSDPVWVRRLGAQFDDRLSKLFLHGDEILVAGHFLGVLKFDIGSLGEITTPGLNFDGFTARLQADGTPTGLLGFGGAGDQFLTDMRSDGDRLLTSGYFVPEITLGVISLNGSTTSLTGFSASQKESGWGWAASLPGTGNTLVELITANSDGQVLIAGSFTQTATFDGVEYAAEGNGEAFFAWLNSDFTPATEVALPDVVVYPNPADEQLFVDGLCEEAVLFLSDQSGRRHPAQSGSSGIFSLTGLPAGMYFLHIHSCGQNRVIRFLKH